MIRSLVSMSLFVTLLSLLAFNYHVFGGEIRVFLSLLIRCVMKGFVCFRPLEKTLFEFCSWLFDMFLRCIMLNFFHGIILHDGLICDPLVIGLFFQGIWRDLFCRTTWTTCKIFRNGLRPQVLVFLSIDSLQREGFESDTWSHEDRAKFSNKYMQRIWYWRRRDRSWFVSLLVAVSLFCHFGPCLIISSDQWSLARNFCQRWSSLVLCSASSANLEVFNM